MPTYQFEAMDATGSGDPGRHRAPTTEEEAQRRSARWATSSTKIVAQEGPPAKTDGARQESKSRFAIGGVGGKKICTFTRQLSILQDAGLPILRSLRDPRRTVRSRAAEERADRRVRRDRRRRDALRGDGQVAQGLRPAVRQHDQGGRGGRCRWKSSCSGWPTSRKRRQALKRKVKGAMIYPVVVVLFAIGDRDLHHDLDHPDVREDLRGLRDRAAGDDQAADPIVESLVNLWFLFPVIPIALILFVMLICKFKRRADGLGSVLLKLPIFGKLIEKNTLARTTRTLGTLVASGVPILEGADDHPRNVRQRHVREAVRQGHRIDPRRRDDCQADEGVLRAGFHPVAAFFWVAAPLPLAPCCSSSPASSPSCGHRRARRLAFLGYFLVIPPRRRRPGRQHGRRRRGNRRTRHDALQGRRHLRRRSRGVDR